MFCTPVLPPIICTQVLSTVILLGSSMHIHGCRTLLQDELLPVVPTAEQMGACWGDATEVFQRIGASALITLIACKLNLTLLASGSLTYFFWGPLLGATNRNRSLRQKGRFGLLSECLSVFTAVAHKCNMTSVTRHAS